jgi:acyl-CoA synthetase (AMP-forming)/AMP-acid ligase II
MLYERWQSVVRSNPRRAALFDAATGQRWTFTQLDEAAGQFELPPVRAVTPQGGGPNFIFNVLAAWKAGRAILPVEGPMPELPETLPRSAAHFKTTSGTTGASQAIAFTAEQLAADADNIVATMGLNAGEPNLGVISLAHSYGFSNLVTPLLLHGIPLVLCSSPMPESIKAAAAGFESLALPAVPAMWRAWFDADAIPVNIRHAISAGAPLPLELETAVFEKCGLKIHNFYGSSECGGIAYDRSSRPRTDSSLVGEPMEGVELSLADDGCLMVSSKAVGMGYLSAENSRLGHGSFRTSDLAELIDGHVFLRGRSSDVINVAGRKLAPEMVEAVIRSQPAVRECVVVGVPARDASRGDEVLAVVSLNGGATLDALRNALSDRLAAWQRPRQWWEVAEIEVSQRGKVSRREWRDKFLAAQAESQKS